MEKKNGNAMAAKVNFLVEDDIIYPSLYTDGKKIYCLDTIQLFTNEKGDVYTTCPIQTAGKKLTIKLNEGKFIQLIQPENIKYTGWKESMKTIPMGVKVFIENRDIDEPLKHNEAIIITKSLPRSSVGVVVNIKTEISLEYINYFNEIQKRKDDPLFIRKQKNEPISIEPKFSVPANNPINRPKPYIKSNGGNNIRFNEDNKSKTSKINKCRLCGTNERIQTVFIEGKMGFECESCALTIQHSIEKNPKKTSKNKYHILLDSDSTVCQQKIKSNMPLAIRTNDNHFIHYENDVMIPINNLSTICPSCRK